MAENNPPVRKLITPEILSDLPIEKVKSDFHFEEFAATLARLIAAPETQTPLTIGVSGPWGSGKTTLLKRLQAQLDGTLGLLDKNAQKAAHLDFANPGEDLQGKFRVCRTVWFNAWKYADENELLVALVRVIVQRMWEDDFITNNLLKVFEPFSDRRNVIDTVLSWFSIKTPFLEVNPDTGEAKPTVFGEKTALLDRFNDVLDRLLAIWIHHSLNKKITRLQPEKGVLVVFIDDLDRCLPAKAVQVLEAVKLFLDRPGCVFVIGADAALTAEAVQTYYKNANVTGQKAGDYLEKIIQLRFDLPPIVPTSMQGYLKTQAVNDEMLDQWETLIAAAEVNPRRVKAVLNDINLQWSMLVNSGQAQEIRRADFIRWNALWRAAPLSERTRILELDDKAVRWNYVRDALRYTQGDADETLRRQFQGYTEPDFRRLREVLRKVGRLDFDADALDAFIHLAALPEKKSELSVSTGFNLETPGVELDVKGGRSESRGGEVSLSSVQTWGGLEFVVIPKGPFRMGSRAEDGEAFDNEKEQHTLELPYEYWMARFPVTNAQFQAFAEAAGYRTTAEVNESGVVREKKASQWVVVKGASWRAPDGPNSSVQKIPDHPVVQISWNDALAYCEWFNQAYHGQRPGDVKLMLPSEAEWEKAARGVYGNRYPWGDDFDSARCNSAEGEIGSTTPVGKYSPGGDSPFGAADMAGNVWEWTRSIYESYPYDPGDGREKLEPKDARRVLRGGSWYYDWRYTRCASRDFNLTELRYWALGFRVVVSPFS
jgi:gamma-glutamyl hercynylcysteine S-oxide synthase